jgi:hypothetical protein
LCFKYVKGCSLRKVCKRPKMHLMVCVFELLAWNPK